MKQSLKLSDSVSSRRAVRLAALVFLVCLRTVVGEGSFHLFKDGAPMAVIVQVGEPPPHRMIFGWQTIPEDVPSDLERAIAIFRADILQGYGVDLPVMVEPAPRHPAPDVLPPNRLEIVWEPRSLMDEDRTDITFPADNVMRLTGGESGIMRTLFYLLEEYGGVRYLFGSGYRSIGFGAHFPERTSLAVPRTPFTHDNRFFPICRHSGRTTYGAWWPGERNRGYYWQWEARMGAKLRVYHDHHLTKIAFPIDQYILSDEKPDDAMFPILRGERMRPWTLGADLSKSYTSRGYRGHWQPCFSSREAEDEAVNNLLAHLRQHPDIQSLSLGVNDNGGHCECEECMDIDGDGTNHMIYPIRSESYYRWVNRVVERVTSEFPDVYFGVLAYREVITPPSFKLHPNVVVSICMDFHVIMDPEMREIWEQLIRDWAAKDANLKVWSYTFCVMEYRLPRFYFPEMQKMLQFLHEHGTIGTLDGSAYFTAFNGPVSYLFFKLLEDPYLDIESVIQDWCDAAVGEEAAPYLRRYYAFWEDFWRTKATRTPWWNSRRSQYLSLGQTSYLNGLEPGDLAHCRELMEQVLTLTKAHGTEDQRKRAGLLMAIFEYSEAIAVAHGAEYFAPDGTLPDPATAVALLRSLPDAHRAYGTAKQLPHDHEEKGWIVPNFASGRIPYAVPGLLAAAGVWMSDPTVLAEFEALAQDSELEPRLRFLASVMHQGEAGGEIDGNLLPNGDFSSEAGTVGTGPDEPHTLRGLDGWQTWSPVHGRLSRSDDVAFRGDHALKCEIRHYNFRVIRRVLDIKPGTAYYFSARIYIPEDQPVQEGRLILRSVPTRLRMGRYSNLTTTITPDIVLTPGQWTYVDQVIPTPRPITDSLLLRIDLRSFEPGDVVYIDDVTVLEITEPDVQNDGR